MASPHSALQIPSRIQDIYIELPDYQFNHSPAIPNAYFTGRDKVMERLKTLLLNSGNSAGGAYLVTGYRGMGKSSMVQRVIKDINLPKGEKAFIGINISLSQDDIKDIDVLKFVATQLERAWLEFTTDGTKSVSASKEDSPHDIDKLLNEVSERLGYLRRRLNSVVKTEISTNDYEQMPVGGNSEVSTGMREEITRRESIPKEIEKELLYILDLIDDAREQSKNIGSRSFPNFVFIVDELDKIEPNYFYDVEYAIKEIPTQEKLDNIFGINKIRRRQEVIARLLANLKNFLNTAKAKFIFIGGREMYDAALADIADRDSFYSSIFHDIIYLDSFFKEKITNSHSGLTRATEVFLCKTILPGSYVKDYWEKKNKTRWNDSLGDSTEGVYNLTTLFHYLVDSHAGKDSERCFHNAKVEHIGIFLDNLKKKSANHQDIYHAVQSVYKTLFFLQNLLVFLTFRSNGTPKKMVSLLESYIVRISPKQLESLKEKMEVVVASKTPASSLKDRLFLRFGFNQQYEIGLTSNIYRPYVIIHSRYLKSLGDKLLYSTAYIIDYLFKFHTHAFSWRNLELIPEIILVNKDPNLRYFLSDILQFLTGMYIRETTNGMFEYTFYSKQSNEIKLLSKISETASAAFNFTLDESLQIIRYYRRKLEELKRTHPNYNQEYIHSIGFIQSILGDLYYFDKEYDEAIIYYTDSVQVLRMRAQQEPKRLTKHQCVLYVRNKLMLGLCLEKIRAFDSAYSIYRGLILNTPLLLESVMTNPGSDELIATGFHDEWDRPIRRMQLFIKPHIALLDLIEKQRMDGITYANLSRNFREVYEFLVDDKAMTPSVEISIGKGVSMAASKKKKDGVRVSTLLADYYSNVGSLLFFKNRNFPELYSRLVDLGLTDDSASNLYEFIHGQKWAAFKHHPGESGLSGESESAPRQKGEHSYLPSVSALAYYFTGLEELVRSYEDQMKLIQESLSKYKRQEFDILNYYSTQDHAVVKALFLLHPECRGIMSNNTLFNFGNMLSRIGDAILSSVSRYSIKEKPLQKKVWDIFCESHYEEAEHGDWSVVQEIFNIIKGRINWICDINQALILYRMAGLFYRKSGRTYSYAFQYKKFLFVLNDYLRCTERESLEKEFSADMGPSQLYDHFAGDCEKVACKIFQANTWITDVSNRPQILKYREVLRFSGKGFDREETRKIYRSLSTSGDIRETLVFVEEIKLKLASILDIRLSDQPENIQSHLTPYDLVTNRFARVHELRYHADVNFYKLRNAGLDEVLMSPVLSDLQILGLLHMKNYSGQILRAMRKALEDRDLDVSLQHILTRPDASSSHKVESIEVNIKERLKRLRKEKKNEEAPGDDKLKQAFPEFFNLRAWVKEKGIKNDWVKQLICDSVFSLFTVIRTLNLYGANYVSSYSFLANVHYKLANWCQVALNYDIIMEKLNDKDKPIKEMLRETLSEEDIHYLEPNYHNEQAIQHFYAAIQTHSGGRAFKKFNRAMSFLEDDFNDNLTLFSAASERFRINTGLVGDKINELKRKIRFSNVYDYDNYIAGWEEYKDEFSDDIHPSDD